MTSNVTSLKKIIDDCSLNVYDKADAFKIAYLMIDVGGENEVHKDNDLSKRAGYPVYLADSGAYICDLDTRLEVNFADGSAKNIWIN